MMQRATFIEPPALFLPHTAERAFIGPGMCLLPDGDLLMAAPWGRPPTDFEQLAAKYPVPMLYRSSDGGRTWRETDRMALPWQHSGMISDGGLTFLWLQDGRLAFLAHRHVLDFHGGGAPVFAASTDTGATWSPAQLLIERDEVYYVMNDRLIQLRSGRLVVPVAWALFGPDGRYIEGDACHGRCFLSDDGGTTWRLGRGEAVLPGDLRGIAEPCVAEVTDNRLLMLSRTGAGCLCANWSEDGGETWSATERTPLTAACSPLTLYTLPDGRLIIFYNHAEPLYPGAFFPRNPLVYAVSADGGRSWSAPVIIDDEGVALIAGQHLQHIYPAACFTGEGIVLVYSTHYADPDGRFGGGGPDAWRVGGGKRCILAYPD
jgi:hypothetical protein